LEPRQHDSVPTCASHQTSYWSQSLGSHTCNMAEHLYGQHFCLTSSNNSICKCVQGLTTLLASHHCVWLDPRKVFVPPRFHRLCNYRCSVYKGVKYKYIYISFKNVFSYAHAWSCSLLFSLSLFLTQAEKRKTGKDFLSMRSAWWLVCVSHQVSVSVTLCRRDLLCGLFESWQLFCSSLSSNSTQLFSEETSTIAVPHRPVFNHWTLCVNITLIY